MVKLFSDAKLFNYNFENLGITLMYKVENCCQGAFFRKIVNATIFIFEFIKSI